MNGRGLLIVGVGRWIERMISAGQDRRGKMRTNTTYTKGGRICRCGDFGGVCGDRILRYCLICRTGGISMGVSRGRLRFRCDKWHRSGILEGDDWAYGEGGTALVRAGETPATRVWIPAFAGMTEGRGGRGESR